MTVINIPKILNERLTDKGAEAFVEIIEKVEKSTKVETIKLAEEKFETRLTKVGSEIRSEMADMNASLRTDMANMNASLRTDMANMKSNIVKWMVSIAIGQMAILLAVLAIFLK
jgi:lipoate synthase